MNVVVLLGRFTRDPELRHLPSGTAQMRSAVAVNRRHKKPDGTAINHTVFVEVEAYGTVAEAIVRYMHKGRQIALRGWLELDQWEDKAGQKRYRHKVVIEQFDFVDRPPPEAGEKPADEPPDESEQGLFPV